jgi:RNA polymerase sigma factor (TIGR02999 family)
MHNVTQMLSAIEQGDPQAAQELLPLVYDELRKLAAARMVAERPDHTLQATALVHEAYVRLVDGEQVRNWDSRGHFFAAAAEAMRRILIESARAKHGAKRGGELQRVELGDPAEETLIGDQDLLLDLDERLCALEAEDPEAAQFVKLRLYAGLSTSEAGRVLGMSRNTAYASWQFVRSWFAVELLQP